jgi:hypothetical protein
MIVLLIVSALVNFGSTALLSRLGLASFKAVHPYIAGITLLISAALTLTYIFDYISSKFNGRLSKRKSRKYIGDLTPDEKELLSLYINGNTKSQFYPLNNGVATGLQRAGIIFLASNVGTLIFGEERFPFNIHDWAWKLLLENPQFIAKPEEARKGRKA